MYVVKIDKNTDDDLCIRYKNKNVHEKYLIKIRYKSIIKILIYIFPLHV